MLLRKKVIVFARLGEKLDLVQFSPTTEHQFEGKVVHTGYQFLNAHYWAVDLTYISAHKIASFFTFEREI